MGALLSALMVVVVIASCWLASVNAAEPSHRLEGIVLEGMVIRSCWSRFTREAMKDRCVDKDTCPDSVQPNESLVWKEKRCALSVTDISRLQMLTED